MAVFNCVNILDNSHAKTVLNRLEYIYKSPARIIGDHSFTPSVTIDKLIRSKVDLPEVNIHTVTDAKIIGDRLVISKAEALSASFLNKRVAHEAAAKRAKDNTVDIDDKFLRADYPEETIESAYWLCGQYGSYQHWFTETLPILWAYQDAHQDFASRKVIVGNDIRPYQVEILKQAGVLEKNIVKKNKNTNIRARSLTICDNFSLNSFWIRPEIKHAYNHIFSKQLITASENKYSEKIILGRKQLGSVRQVFNFDRIESALVNQGYQIVFPEDMSFPEKINCFQNAKRIVSLSGGGLCNLVFCKPRTKVLSISPDSFPINTFRDLSEIYELDITYCLARSFLRYDDINLNANSFLTENIIQEITSEKWANQ